MQLGQIVDAMRGQPDETPMKAWANAQIERITDHQQKEAWSDRFERKKLINDWRTREAFGPVVGMLDGAAGDLDATWSSSSSHSAAGIRIRSLTHSSSSEAEPGA